MGTCLPTASMNRPHLTPPPHRPNRIRGPVQAALLIGAALAAAITGYLHHGPLHDVILWDEADYAIAAQHGFLANALDQDNLNTDYRHAHAPLSIYAIRVSTALLGVHEWSVRLPGVIVSALTAGLMVLAGYDLSRGSHRARLMVGVVAGLLFATAPASVWMTRVARPHPFVAFFLLLNIWTLCRYLIRPTPRHAVLFGLSLAGQFVSMEYGPVIVLLSLAAIALVRPEQLGLIRRWPFVSWRGRFPFVSMNRDVWVTMGSCLAGIAAVWPAGLYRLSVLLNFGFYVRYGQGGHRSLFRGQLYQHVPKYAYAWWYGTQHPLLLVGMVTAVVLILVWAWRSRGSVAVTLAVFTLGLGAVVHASHIMELCYSLFVIPPIALGGPMAGLWLVRALTAEGLTSHAYGFGPGRWSPNAQIVGGLLAIIAVGSVLSGQAQPLAPRDNANTQIIQVSRTLGQLAKPGDAVLAQTWPIVRYVLLGMGRTDVTVHRYDPVNAQRDNLQSQLDIGKFQWVVTAGPTAGAHPDCPVLVRLHDRWRVMAQTADPPREYRLYAPPDLVQAIR